MGTWNRGAAANFTRNFTETFSDIIQSLHNQTLVVTTLLVRGKKERMKERPAKNAGCKEPFFLELPFLV